MTKTLTIASLSINVHDIGDGPPLVLIHGLGGPLMWQRVTSPLAEHRRVVVIDLPGFGNSAPPPRPYGPEDYAANIVQCLDALNIGRADLAGISYGGQISATLASCYPDRVRKLILICSTGLMKEQPVISNGMLWRLFRTVIKYTALRSKSLMCRLGRRSFFTEMSRPADLCDEFYRQLSRPGARDAWLNAFRNSFAKREKFLGVVGSLRVPTLIVWGDCDITVSPKLAVELQQAIEGSVVVTFPQCAHSVPLEKPDELCRVLEEFLRGPEG